MISHVTCDSCNQQPKGTQTNPIQNQRPLVFCRRRRRHQDHHHRQFRRVTATKKCFQQNVRQWQFYADTLSITSRYARKVTRECIKLFTRRP